MAWLRWTLQPAGRRPLDVRNVIGKSVDAGARP